VWLCKRAVEKGDEDDLGHDSEDGEGSMESRIFDLTGGEAENDKGAGAEIVGDAEVLKVVRAFEDRVEDVAAKDRAEKAEDPGASGVEVMTNIGVVSERFRIEDRAEKVKEDDVEADEEVVREGPLRDVFEAEFPPPGVDEIEEEEECPEDVYPVDFFETWMFDEAGDTLEQMGETEAEENADEDFYVAVEFHDCERPLV
jgi:hypothetical protein